MKKINKIMLIEPGMVMPNDSIRRIGEPLGLLYIASSLEKHGYKVNILDSSAEGYNEITDLGGGYIHYGLSDQEILKRIKTFQPDAVGVSSLFSARIQETLKICKLAKEAGDITVIVGGLHPSLYPRDILADRNVDYIVMREGEERLVKLLEGDLDIDGIAYKKGGRVIINQPTSRIEDLDSLPLPARHLVDLERYFDIAVPYAPFFKSNRVVQILTSRGCPGKCNFCSTVNYWGRKFRKRSVDNIMEEIELLKERYNIGEVQFIDDNLTADPKRAKELFRRMKHLNIHWCTPHGLMTNTVDEELLRVMGQSGCYQISMAIESASPRVLKEIVHKNVDLDKSKHLIRKAHENGISVHLLFLVGLPGETKEEIYQTLDFPSQTEADSISFFIASPLPGSELYDYSLEKGYLYGGDFGMDLKKVKIRIPKDSPDNYGIEPEKLEKMVERRTREFNEASRRRNPKAWENKFEGFLIKHPELSEMIMGRVT
ncbi:MAG: radical SAM protein [Candidatus Omnitrophota bacterium]